jgi:hypothetical protein
LINTVDTFKSLLNNLIIEEENLYEKYKRYIDNNDNLNKMLIFGERQNLLNKIIQQLSIPYLETIEMEIYNINHYIQYLKITNSNLRIKIEQFEMINNKYDD